MCRTRTFGSPEPHDFSRWEWSVGRNQYFQVRNQQLVCNMFAENITTGNRADTDYDALAKCLHRLLREAKSFRCKTVAIPGYLGCGLAGGDWDYVYSDIIKPIFEESEIKLSIVYFPDAMEKLWKSYHNVKKKKTSLKNHGMDSQKVQIPKRLKNI